jgi:hypothetical protein
MTPPKTLFGPPLRMMSRLMSRRRRAPGPAGSWSVVSTMRGTPEIVAPFVAHHLATEALGVHVYLDEANPEVEAMLAPLAPRLAVTVCDAAYWAGTRFRTKPDVIIARQLFNAEHARKRTPAAWLVHIDSDEFLVPAVTGAPSLAAELAGISPDRHWVRLTHRERVFVRDVPPQSIFDGVFRKRIEDAALVKEIYGPGHHFLRSGYSGYTRGKTATRVDAPVRMRIHTASWPHQSGEAPEAELPAFTVSTGTQVVHFDGWTPLQWTAKLLRRVDTNRIDSGHAGRRAQLHFMNDASSLAERLSLFEMIQTLPADRIAQLLQMGLMTDAPFDPRPAVAQAFPGRSLSFAIADFDAGLRQSDPAFYTRHGLMA